MDQATERRAYPRHESTTRADQLESARRDYFSATKAESGQSFDDHSTPSFAFDNGLHRPTSPWTLPPFLSALPLDSQRPPNPVAVQFHSTSTATFSSPTTTAQDQPISSAYRFGQSFAREANRALLNQLDSNRFSNSPLRRTSLATSHVYQGLRDRTAFPATLELPLFDYEIARTAPHTAPPMMLHHFPPSPSTKFFPFSTQHNPHPPTTDFQADYSFPPISHQHDYSFPPFAHPTQSQLAPQHYEVPSQDYDHQLDSANSSFFQAESYEYRQYCESSTRRSIAATNPFFLPFVPSPPTLPHQPLPSSTIEPLSSSAFNHQQAEQRRRGSSVDCLEDLLAANRASLLPPPLHANNSAPPSISPSYRQSFSPVVSSRTSPDQSIVETSPTKKRSALTKPKSKKKKATEVNSRFINYTALDAKKLSNGVARSGKQNRYRATKVLELEIQGRDQSSPMGSGTSGE